MCVCVIVMRMVLFMNIKYDVKPMCMCYCGESCLVNGHRCSYYRGSDTLSEGKVTGDARGADSSDPRLLPKGEATSQNKINHSLLLSIKNSKWILFLSWRNTATTCRHQRRHSM